MSRGLSRRRFLAGAGGVTLGLPLLQSMGALAASSRAGSTAPTRLLIFFTPNGCVQSQRLTSTDPVDFAFGPSMAPLTPHRDRLVVLDGISMNTIELGPGDPHQRGIGQMLTGMPLEEGVLFEPFDGGIYAGWGGGISVDQVVADHLLGETWLKSLEEGVQTMLRPALDVWGVCCYAGPGQPIPPENDPSRVFQRLFGGGAQGVEAITRLHAQRRSVLDLVLGDFKALEQRVGADDRAKLELHQTAIRDLEIRLQAQGSAGPGCSPGAAPQAYDLTDPDQFEAIGRAQIDLMVQAFACDLTRVGTVQWSAANGDQIFSDLGLDMGHHGITHEVWDDMVTQHLVDIDAWYARQFAYLLDALAAVPEGAGTLLDQTLVVWVNELDEGYGHSFSNMPYVLAGGAGGQLSTGRCLSFNETSHTDMLVSVLQLMGLSVETFGQPEYCSGPLVGLV
ncbi:MAG: DUF1552 domain-containing protein [Myxococcota bacterium]|nr:DUF1552 domain-containing protein [Myxococcota bacterium]